MSLSRNIPQAHATVKAGRWDRKNFEGVELYGKTLAVLGMGRIGTEYARRAMAFGMKVLAFDPYLSASRARTLQVELVENLEDILPRADFITLHMPVTPETHHMLGATQIAKMKKGVRIINCARGGLIDEAALYEGLKSGQVAGAALDVYEVEPPPAEGFPLRDLPNIIFTPHLGASTAEAQESVGIEVAQQIRSALLEGEIRNAVNMPNIDAKTLAIIGPQLALGEKLGIFLSQLAPKRCDSLNINYSGKINEVDTTPITRAVLKGFLQAVYGSEVNSVNAASLAETLGVKVTESRVNTPGEFSELIEVSATDTIKVSVAGTFFGNTPRIVKINDRHVEAKPEGALLVLENRDRPGIVGLIGSLMGTHKVNIASMSLSRNEIGGNALTVLNVDSAPSEAVLKEMLAVEDIFSAKVVQL